MSLSKQWQLRLTDYRESSLKASQLSFCRLVGEHRTSAMTEEKAAKDCKHRSLSDFPASEVDEGRALQ